MKFKALSLLTIAGLAWPMGAFLDNDATPSPSFGALNAAAVADEAAQAALDEEQGAEPDPSQTEPPAYSNETFLGPWMVCVTEPINAVVYFCGDGKGIISDHSSIVRKGYEKTAGAPGLYQVSEDGSFILIIGTERQEEDIVVTGTLTSDSQGLLNEPLSGTVSRITDRSACRGRWTGTLTEYSGKTTHIEFHVDSIGNIVSFTGLKGHTFGRMFRDGPQVQFFVKTGEPDYYNQVSITATLTDDTLSGVFFYDGPDSPNGDATLTRQEWNPQPPAPDAS